MTKDKQQPRPASHPDVPSRTAAPNCAENPSAQSDGAGSELSGDQARRLVHELQVHQVELEMQNDELRQVRQQLEAAHARYFDLYNLAPVGYVTLDEGGTILEANLRASALLGAAKSGLIGESLTAAVVVEDREAVRELLHELFASGAAQTAEFRLLRPHGKVAWVRAEAVIARDARSDFGLCRATLTDVSERKQAEDDIRIAAVAFDVPQGMMVTDVRGEILRVNRAFAEITGFDAAEAVGKTPRLLRSNRQDTTFYRGMWEAIINEGHWEGEIWNRRKDGAIYPEWLAISAIRDAAGSVTHYLGAFSDITEPKESQRKILELAFYDSLTGLPNRRLLLDRLDQALAASARSGQHGALLLLDLDHFKTLNDTRGHPLGDRLLMEAARRIAMPLRQMDTASRFGGDEFVVVLLDLPADALAAAVTAGEIAERLRLALREPYQMESISYHLSSSIGVTLFRGRDDDGSTILKHADLALYRAKDAGRDTVRFYSPDMQAAIDAHTQIETGLRRALDGAEEQRANGWTGSADAVEFKLVYQPQVRADGRVVGAEALLRWQPPGSDAITPAMFVPVAETSGLILPLGRFVLESACRQLVSWAAKPSTRGLNLAVNISAQQFRQTDFAAELTMLMRKSGVNPERLRLELTESSVLQDVEAAIRTMKEINALGVSFSMDDFGTGCSSLANLKRLPLQEIKIDQAFVRDIPGDADDCAIAEAILALGRSLRLQVIAEGVEYEPQRDFLAGHDCALFQGYLYGRPGPAEAIEEMVNATN